MSELVPYGIQNENSTHRVHLDATDDKLIVFETWAGIKALPEPVEVSSQDDWVANGYYLVKPQWNNYSPTARGIRVHYENITGALAIDIPPDFADVFDRPTSASDTSSKGQYAQALVDMMLQDGRIPIKFKTREIVNRLDQIRGIDLEAEPLSVQIKFDMGCYARGVFLQTHERNPYKFH